MNKIIKPKLAKKLAKNLNKEKLKIVLAGGCFDILHIGHITYLNAAKKAGDVLFVLLESDLSIKKLKGSSRPINTQNDRAKILEKIDIVDYIILLPSLLNNIDYDKLVTSLKPAIIAITKGDNTQAHKERQANLIGAQVKNVANPIKNTSTTKLIKILGDL